MEKALKATAILEHLMTCCGVELHNACAEALKELKEIVKPKTCNGCKTLPFVLTELSKKNGGKCGTCKRYVKDNYQAEPKE